MTSNTQHTVPQALLDAVTSYAKQGNMQNNNALIAAVIEVVISPQAPITAEDYAHWVVIAAHCGLSPYANIGGSKLTHSPTTMSPHAPVPKPKKPYWIKVITSVDTNQVNGFGIKGKFITEGEVVLLPKDKHLLVQIKEKPSSKTYAAYLLETTGSHADAEMLLSPSPASYSLTLEGVRVVAAGDYAEIFDHIEEHCGELCL